MPKAKVVKKFEVIRQDWIESERGWGTRPDGYSLHRTEEDRMAYIKDYWKKMPDEAPDEYSRPDVVPRKVKVTKKEFEQIKKSKNGVRHYS